MVRLTVLYGTPSDSAAFDGHYYGVHTPLAKKLPGLRHFILRQQVTAVVGSPYYLIADLDFDDMAAFQHAFQSPEGQAAVQDLTQNITRFTSDIRAMVSEPKNA